MASTGISLHVLLSLLIAACHSNRTYTVIPRTASSLTCLCAPSTPDQMYIRVCNNSECSTFLSLPDGMNLGGTEFTFEITTPTDIGEINKVQIVHMGDDQSCIDWIKVDDVKYDYSTLTASRYCFASSDSSDSSCSTLTITSANSWSVSATANPCEFSSMFDDTYNPTPQPTPNTLSPTIPSKAPTSDPTMDPTVDPTVDPTHDPTDDPTLVPTKFCIHFHNRQPL